jgi:hypothetical protein
MIPTRGKLMGLVQKLKICLNLLDYSHQHLLIYLLQPQNHKKTFSNYLSSLPTCLNMTQTSCDKLFTKRRSSYRPRPTPLADQLRDLETLQRIQTGTDPRLLINPDIVLAHHQLQQDLHWQTDPDPADGKNQPNEDFNHYNPASEANEDVDTHFSLIDELNAHHTSVDQRNQHQSINNHWTRLIPT